MVRINPTPALKGGKKQKPKTKNQNLFIYFFSFCILFCIGIMNLKNLFPWAYIFV